MVGPSLSHTALRFQEPFYKNPPTNAVVISVVDPFRRPASVFNSGRAIQVAQLLSVSSMKTMEDCCRQ